MLISNILLANKNLFKSLQQTKCRSLLLALILSIVSGCAANPVGNISQHQSTDKDAVGASRWIAESASGIRFEFAQRIPDQTRSFYLAREFPPAAASRYATACIFQTILNNNSKDLILKINLSDWRVVYKDKKIPLQLVQDWQKLWKKMNISKTGRIAFRWSQFPKIQVHKPTDWFQGMTAFSLPPGTVFNLYVKWYENDEPRDAIIHNLKCPDDRRLDK